MKKATEDKQASQGKLQRTLDDNFLSKKGVPCEGLVTVRLVLWALENLSLHLLETHRQLISLNYAQCFVAKNLATNKASKLPAVPHTT